MILPSKELLSAVLGYRVTTVKSMKENTLNFDAIVGSIEVEEIINVYELIYVMKVWAFKKGYFLIENHSSVVVAHPSGKYLNITYANNGEMFSFENVINAAEWVLDQQK